MNGNQKM